MTVDVSRAAAMTRASEMLRRMNIDEKAQQVVGLPPWALMKPGGPSPEQLETSLSGGIGSVEMWAMFHHLSPAAHARTVNTIQRYLVENTRLGIPAIFQLEALNGLVAPGYTTFPTGIALGSTWNPAAVGEMAGLAARQARSIGYTRALSPVMDVARDARWGRVHEAYGEDPLLVAEFSTAFVQGMQGADLRTGIHATGKHFVGFGVTEGGQHMGATAVAGRALREVHVLPFETAIREAGLRTIMNSYSTIDGIPAGANPAILDDLLRGELGFDGTVVSDYGTTGHLIDRLRVADAPEHAARMALEAGLDMELPQAHVYGPSLATAVRAGRIPEELLDRAVLRVLRDKFELGLFDNPYVDETADVVDGIAREGSDLALDLARESVILLRNDGTLPLSRPMRRVAVIGPHGGSASIGFAAYSHVAALRLLGAVTDGNLVNMAGLEGAAGELTEDGARALSTQVSPHLADGLNAYLKRTYGAVTLTDALRELLPDTEIVGAEGTGVLDGEQEDIDAAIEMSKSADAIVLALGGRAGWFGQRLTEGESTDQANVDLPAPQVRLARAVAIMGVPTVTVVFTGRPFALAEIDDLPGALVHAPYGGQHAARAVAEVLLGVVNPSGRLSISLPRHSGQIPLHSGQHTGSGYRRSPDGDTYRGYNDMPASPLYPFGHGLSYSTVEYGELLSSATHIPTDGSFSVTVSVTNVGDRSTTEVVQFYASVRAHIVTRPAQQLVAFARVDLEPGQRRTVRSDISTGQLAYLGARGGFVFESGTLDVKVGASSDDIRSQVRIVADGAAADWSVARPLRATVVISDPVEG